MVVILYVVFNEKDYGGVKHKTIEGNAVFAPSNSLNTCSMHVRMV